MVTPTPDSKDSWQTPFGAIHKGMKVVDDAGNIVGTVEGLDGDELLLAEHANGKQPSFVSTTMVGGIDGETVILATRGDASFGLGAEP